MANNVLALPGGGNLPALARDFLDANSELGGGISTGFAVFSIKGKVWRVKYKGEETILTRPDDGTPVPYVDVVIVKAPDHLSKVFYEKGFVDGSNEAPDCYSTNGQVPAADSPKKQHSSCLLCPWNKFGSRISENGSKGKRCADAKRLAVIPANDIDGELWGGPMLLRTPAASLKAIDAFVRQVKMAQVPYFAVVARIGFDVQKPHPELIFSPVRYLNDEEFSKVVALRDDDRTQRILDEVLVEEYGVTDEGNGLGLQGSPPAGATVGTQAQPSLSQRAAASVQRPTPAQAPKPAQAAPQPAQQASQPAAEQPMTAAQAEAVTAKPKAAPKPKPEPTPAPVQAAQETVTDAEYTEEASSNAAETEANEGGAPADFDALMDDLLG